MKEIRSILFPTDFSAVANSALPLAATLARAFGASIQIGHISDGGDPHVTETSRYEFPKLDAEFSGVRVEELVIPKGDAEYADIIMREAQSRNCDLIVMASHGRSDVAQFFLGRSVAERVARDSQIPTIIARLYGARRTTRPIERFARIVYATDLTENTRAVLPTAAAIARKTGASLEAICVFGEGDEQPADGGQATLERFFAEAEASDYLGDFETLRGGVAEAVVGYATINEVDLIAITTELCCGGNRNLTDTAEYIIRNAPCPVLCVRKPRKAKR
jgi:nucleotide-binding universal stress UspA family protein